MTTKPRLSVKEFDDLYDLCSQRLLLSPAQAAAAIRKVDGMPYEDARRWIIAAVRIHKQVMA